MVAEMMAQVLYHGYNDQDFHLIQFRLKETIPDVLVFVCGVCLFVFKVF